MRPLLIALLSLLLCLSSRPVTALTWDEPWHEQVVKQADAFVLGKIIASDARKGATVRVLQSLGGAPLAGTVRITGFYLLDVCSSSGGHGPEFYFGKADTCYFFLKKNASGDYSMATPTTGFAAVSGGRVVATYRHSYHQALVPPAVYEPTMTAIFRHYHGQDYNAAPIDALVARYLALPPAALDEAGQSTFFLQHIALETLYHLGRPVPPALVLPFLRDTKNFHAQVSAARALSASHTPEAQQLLLALLRDPITGNFTKTVAVHALAAAGAGAALKPALQELVATASTQANGFGGNIMDPRVCTHFPSVKTALEQLVSQL